MTVNRPERQRCGGAIPFLMVLALLVITGHIQAAESVDYVRDIKPIFKSRCVACHGALKQESGLRLDAGTLIQKGGDGGAVISIASVHESPLLVRVISNDLSTRMPPEGEPLKPDQIERIREWITQGALFPKSERPESDPREHWAFQPPVCSPIPTIEPSDSNNPIDSFLTDEAVKQGLQPVEPAEKLFLLRRVSFDLIGLPPTRREIHEFQNDSTPDAYERVVDRLLTDPRHGERWGRRWMDVWRYSDWYGRRSVPDVMNSYPMVWRWRDWIVRSLNENKPYDRMIVEMLAADELCPDDVENVVATGFIVRNWFKWNYDQWMRDQVEHTGKAFVGLWFQCGLCHDHKYDPISQKEYFQLRAFFEPMELRHDRVQGEADPGPFAKYIYGKAYGPISSGLIRVFDEKLTAETRLYSKGDQRNIVKDLPAMQPAVPKFLEQSPLIVQPVNLPLSAWYPNLTEQVLQEELAKRESAMVAAESAYREAHDHSTSLIEAKWKLARMNLVSYKARVAAELAKHVTRSANLDELARQAADAERQANYESVRVSLLVAEQSLESARSLPVSDKKQDEMKQQEMKRSEAIKKAEQAVATSKEALAKAEMELKKTDLQYSSLGPVYPNQTTGRRTALARWLTDRSNPLTARVAVNHMWNWHFGRPFVETVSNFGRNGKTPSHPQLLDWLSVELMERGWDQRHLHRLIVCSEHYRRSSHVDVDHANMKRDQDNHYFWRSSVRRIEAEAVRDTILYVSGQLDLKMGGPEIDQTQGLTSRRRSLYFAHHGEARTQFLELFDAASPIDCYQRTTSILPQQALALSNSDLTREQSRQLAHRLLSQLADSTTAAESINHQFVTIAFETILSRTPTEEEIGASMRFLERQQALFVENAQQAKTQESTRGIERQSSAPIAETAQKSTASAGQSNSTTDGANRGLIDPVLRSQESLIHALLNHNDFLTMR